MPKLYSSDTIYKVLLSLGFVFVSQKGSHMKLRRGKLTVILPANKKEIPVGTFRSILRQASLELSEFEKLVK